MTSTIALAIILNLTNAGGAPASVVGRAQTEVVRLFRSIDVDVEWSRSSRSIVEDAPHIHVVIAPYESGFLQLRPHTVMGAAIYTDNGTALAYVYYRRVQSEARQYGSSEALVLACAIAHEVAHHLLPGRTHSTLGLMRASWDRDDFNRAERGQLRFSDEEAALIRARVSEGS
jgi:hypothetical protein